MNLPTYIVLGIIIVLVICSVRYTRSKKKNSTGCSSCSGCTMADCPSRKTDNKKAPY